MLAGLEFLSDVTTNESNLELTDQTLEDEVCSIYNTYITQAGRTFTSTTQKLREAPGADLEAIDHRDRVETVDHVLRLSFNFIRGKHNELVLWGAIPQDVTLEDYVKERMSLLLLNHLLKNENLMGIAIGKILMEYFNGKNPYFTLEDLVNAYIEKLLDNDRITQEVRETKSNIDLFNEEVKRIVTPVQYRKDLETDEDKFFYIFNSLLLYLLNLEESALEEIFENLQFLYPFEVSDFLKYIKDDEKNTPEGKDYICSHLARIVATYKYNESLSISVQEVKQVFGEVAPVEG